MLEPLSFQTPDRPTLTPSGVRALAYQSVFGDRLVANNFRGVIAEALVAASLDPTWRWCSNDYSGWDFDRQDGVRLEVKQSAVLQTWNEEDRKRSACRFDIKPRKRCYVDSIWHEQAGRNADIYVLAQHHVADATADHARPDQWRFFVIAERALPAQRSLGLPAASKLSTAYSHEDFAMAVQDLAATEVQKGLIHRAGR